MKSLINKFVNMWLHPWSTLQSVKEQGEHTIPASLLFIAVISVLSGIIMGILGLIVSPEFVLNVPMTKPQFVLLAFLLFPIMVIALSFVGSFFMWAVLYGFFKGEWATYKAIYHMTALLMAYTPLGVILNVIPVVGIWLSYALQLWVLFLMVRGGIVQVLGFSWGRTGVGALLLLLFLVLNIILILIIYAGQPGGLPGAPGTALNNNLGTVMEEDINAQMRDMAERARTGATPAPR